MGTHATEKKYKCHVCQKTFNVKYRLTEHLSEKHGIREVNRELNIVHDNDVDDVAMENLGHNVMGENSAIYTWILR